MPRTLTAKTGPKTPAGKLAVRRNALRHGLVSEIPLIPGEDEFEWDRFRQAFVGALGPDQGYEAALAERAARLEWRLMRAERYEAELLALAGRHATRTRRGPHHGADLDEPSLAGAVGFPDEIDRVQRYEAHLHRIQISVLHELEAAQRRRRGQDAPLARLDFSNPAVAASFPTLDAYMAAQRRAARHASPAGRPHLDTLGTLTPADDLLASAPGGPIHLGDSSSPLPPVFAEQFDFPDYDRVNTRISSGPLPTLARALPPSRSK